MKRVVGLFTGKKIGLEEFKNKDNKVVNYLHMLNGYESTKFSIRDEALLKELKSYPDMEEIQVKAEVQEYKSELYLQALEVII